MIQSGIPTLIMLSCSRRTAFSPVTERNLASLSAGSGPRFAGRSLTGPASPADVAEPGTGGGTFTRAPAPAPAAAPPLLNARPSERNATRSARGTTLPTEAVRAAAAPRPTAVAVHSRMMSGTEPWRTA